MEACPAGWHLPDTTEWNVLFAAVGCARFAGKFLKSTEGWQNGGNGTDEYGFSALPVERKYGLNFQNSKKNMLLFGVLRKFPKKARMEFS